MQTRAVTFAACGRRNHCPEMDFSAIDNRRYRPLPGPSPKVPLTPTKWDQSPYKQDLQSPKAAVYPYV